jgi:peptide-methionine (S)-S-oxide reductase
LNRLVEVLSSKDGQIITISNYEKLATLGGGCFWCLEAVFQEIRGIDTVISGYSGGKLENPSYEEVCSGTTGYAEVVQISFKPEIITFEEILEIFFTIHNPTQLNRQGNDVGTQYRSVIFFHSDRQREESEYMIYSLRKSKVWTDPIVTEVKPFEIFYQAEEYHQNYYQRNANQPYCSAVISPKLYKLHQKFSHKVLLKR